MNSVDLAFALGQPTVGSIFRVLAPTRTYGIERVPRHGGMVLALNHFSWLDPPIVAARFPRPIYYVAKSEAMRIPLVGPFIALFGTFAIRRGESDRDAVRKMRSLVRDGHCLGLFVEGTRQKEHPGPVQPGAAMVAIQEDVPVVCCVIQGSQYWRPGNFGPVSIAYSEPMRFEGLPRNAKGYREASAQIEAEIRRVWDWLAAVHEQKPRPRHAVPPA